MNLAPRATPRQGYGAIPHDLSASISTSEVATTIAVFVLSCSIALVTLVRHCKQHGPWPGKPMKWAAMTARTRFVYLLACMVILDSISHCIFALELLLLNEGNFYVYRIITLLAGPGTFMPVGTVRHPPLLLRSRRRTR